MADSNSDRLLLKVSVVLLEDVELLEVEPDEDRE